MVIYLSFLKEQRVFHMIRERASSGLKRRQARCLSGQAVPADASLISTLFCSDALLMTVVVIASALEWPFHAHSPSGSGRAFVSLLELPLPPPSHP